MTESSKFKLRRPQSLATPESLEKAGFFKLKKSNTF